MENIRLVFNTDNKLLAIVRRKGGIMDFDTDQLKANMVEVFDSEQTNELTIVGPLTAQQIQDLDTQYSSGNLPKWTGSAIGWEAIATRQTYMLSRYSDYYNL